MNESTLFLTCFIRFWLVSHIFLHGPNKFEVPYDEISASFTHICTNLCCFPHIIFIVYHQSGTKRKKKDQRNYHNGISQEECIAFSHDLYQRRVELTNSMLCAI